MSSHTLKWVFLGPDEAHSRLNRGHQSSDMAETSLELAVRAGGDGFHYVQQNDTHLLSSRHAGRDYEWKLALKRG